MANGKSFDDFYEQAVQNYSGAAATTKSAEAAGIDFCSIWPVVRQGLEFLKGRVPLWARIVIDALIAFGDSQCQ